jgi:hypothetical protein
LKRPELTGPIAAGLVAGSAHRQIARSIRCAPSTVTRRAGRLGRHALLLLSRALGHLGPLDEPIVIDHFETFEFTQDLPFGVATPVGQRSAFVYGLDPAPHARTGRRSSAQRRKLARRLKREEKGGYAGSFERTVDALLALRCKDAQVALVTDGHKDYERMLRAPKYRGRVVHAAYPNPKRGAKGDLRSEEAVVRDREMFQVDHLHRLLRHSVAHYRRETIAFGRRLNAIMERLFLTSIWRNFVKGVSERDPRSPTPAMTLGLAMNRWTWQRVFARRLFPLRCDVPNTWMELYRREWTTPVLPINRRHELRHAQ